MYLGFQYRDCLDVQLHLFELVIHHSVSNPLLPKVFLRLQHLCRQGVHLGLVAVMIGRLLLTLGSFKIFP
jgi:hypothetical protein